MKNYLYVALFTLLTFGCAEKLREGSGMGRVNFGLKMGAEDIIIRTKAATTAPYHLTIRNEKDEIVSIVEDLNSENNTIPLLAKTYNANVESGTQVASGFDVPYYVGNQDFTVLSDVVTNVDLKVKLGNIKITVECSPELISYLKNVETVVKINNIDKSKLTFGKTETRAGYFKAIGETDKINWSLALTPNTGDIFELEGEVLNIKPNDHVKILFTLEEKGATGGVKINPVIVVEDVVKVENDFEVEFPAHPKIQLQAGNINEVQNSISALPDPLVIDIDASKISLLNMTYKCDHLKNSMSGRETIDILLNGEIPEPTVISDFIENGINIEFLPATATAANPVRVTITADFLKNKNLTDTPDNGTPYEFTFTVKDDQKRILTQKLRFNKINSDVLTNPSEKNDRWATKLIVRGRWIEIQPTSLSFEYLKEGEEDWKSINAVEINAANKSFSAKILNLEPSTNYIVRAKGAKNGNSMEVRTSDVIQLPNNGFNNWSKSGNTWYARGASDAPFWDSGNKGATTIGSNNPTEPDGTDKTEGANALKLESKVIVGNFAAGNLFVGEFIRVDILSTTATMTFGRPFEARPNRLEGYYKYNGKNISHAGGGKESLKGKPDRYSMIVLLTDGKNMPFLLNVKNKSPFDIDKIMATGTDGTINAIASGVRSNEQIVDGVDQTTLLNMTNFEKFNIDLKYHEANKNLGVKYIVVIFSASKYGDFFTGGEGSTLRIDDLMFHYDFNN